MTVAAVDAVAARVMLVAERYGLRLRHILIRGIRRALHFQGRPEQYRHDHHHPDDRRACNCVRTTMEDLAHLYEAFQFCGCGSRLPLRRPGSCGTAKCMSQLDVTFITQVSDYNKVGSVFCKWDAIIAEECFPIVAQIQKKDCKSLFQYKMSLKENSVSNTR